MSKARCGPRAHAPAHLPAQMSQLYSAGKLQRAFVAKKWVISAVVHLASEVMRPTGKTVGEDHMPRYSLEWEGVATSGLTTPGGYTRLVDITQNQCDLGSVTGSNLWQLAKEGFCDGNHLEYVCVVASNATRAAC